MNHCYDCVGAMHIRFKMRRNIVQACCAHCGRVLEEHRVNDIRDTRYYIPKRSDRWKYVDWLNEKYKDCFV